MKNGVVQRPRMNYDAGRPSPYHESPPRSLTPNSEFSISGQTLRNWARHLADNSSIVTAILSSRSANAIGPGLTYEPLTRDRKGNLIEELNDELRRIHQTWSRSVDVTGELNRSEVERLAWRTWDLDGESFIRSLVYDKDGRKLPYAVQMIETEWIPTYLTMNRNNEYIIHGIAKDEWGRPLKYYIEPNKYDIYSYPGYVANPEKMQTIQASEMTHIKRVLRPNQARGVTLFHSVIFRISDIAEYQEAHRLAARASADLFASINRSPDIDPEISENANRKWQFEHLQMIDGLQPGETVNFHDPEHPNQNAVEFVREELRSIASACDTGFSQIAQVFDSSYAAQRLEVVDTWRKVERDRSKFIADFARPALYEKVIEMARLSITLPTRAMRRLDPKTFYDCRIDGPTMPVIDPVKDRGAFKLDQDKGWDSRRGIIRRMGRNPSDVDAERASDDQLPEDREIVRNSVEDKENG